MFFTVLLQNDFSRQKNVVSSSTSHLEHNMSLNFFHNWESKRVYRDVKKMFSNPVTIFSGGNVLICVFFDGKTPHESFWRRTKDIVSTHYLAEVPATFYWIVLHECIEIRILKTMTLFKKKDTRVSGQKSVLLILVVVQWYFFWMHVKAE